MLRAGSVGRSHRPDHRVELLSDAPRAVRIEIVTRPAGGQADGRDAPHARPWGSSDTGSGLAEYDGDRTVFDAVGHVAGDRRSSESRPGITTHPNGAGPQLMATESVEARDETPRLRKAEWLCAADASFVTLFSERSEVPMSHLFRRGGGCLVVLALSLPPNAASQPGHELPAPAAACLPLRVDPGYSCQPEGVVPGRYTGSFYLLEDRTALEVPPGGIGVYSFFEISLDVFGDGTAKGSTNARWASDVLAKPGTGWPANPIVSAEHVAIDVTSGSITSASTVVLTYQESGGVVRCIDNSCNANTRPERYTDEVFLNVNRSDDECATALEVNISGTRIGTEAASWYHRFGLAADPVLIQLKLAQADLDRHVVTMSKTRQRLSEFDQSLIESPDGHDTANAWFATVLKEAGTDSCAESLVKQEWSNALAKMIRVDADKARSAALYESYPFLAERMEWWTVHHAVNHALSIEYLGCTVDTATLLDPFSRPLYNAGERLLSHHWLGSAARMTVLRQWLFGLLAFNPRTAIRVADQTYSDLVLNYASAEPWRQQSLIATAMLAEYFVKEFLGTSRELVSTWLEEHGLTEGL